MKCTPGSPTGSLRILIVDNRYPRGLGIEQKQNLLGYWRIALSRPLNELTAPSGAPSTRTAFGGGHIRTQSHDYCPERLIQQRIPYRPQLCFVYRADD